MIYDDDTAKLKAVRLKVLIKRFDLADFVEDEWGNDYEKYKQSEIFSILDAYDELALERIATEKERKWLRSNLYKLDKKLVDAKKEMDYYRAYIDGIARGLKDAVEKYNSNLEIHNETKDELKENLENIADSIKYS